MRAKAIYAAIVIFVTLLSITLGNIWYTNHVADERAREICGLIVVLDDAYRQTPPQTALGQHVAAEMHAYRLRLGC